MRDGQDTHELELAKARMGDLFYSVFVGRDVEYEEMLEEQRRLWPVDNLGCAPRGRPADGPTGPSTTRQAKAG